MLTRASQESPSRVAPPGARRGHPRYARVHAFARPRTPETMSADETADLDALQLVCPITAELFEDPVLLVEDGHTYERSAVTAWLEKHDTSPMSGAALATKTLAPNIRARQQADTALGGKPPNDAKRHNEFTNLGPANAAATGASERNARFVRRPLEIEPAPPPSAPPPPPPAPGKLPLTPPNAEKMSREAAEAAKKARADAKTAEALMDEERKAAEADEMDPGEAASSKERRLPSKEEHAAKGERKQWQKEAAAKAAELQKEAAANAAELTRWVRSYDAPNGGPRAMQRPAYAWFDSHDPWEHRWPVHRAAMRGECDRIREDDGLVRQRTARVGGEFRPAGRGACFDRVRRRSAPAAQRRREHAFAGRRARGTRARRSILEGVRVQKSEWGTCFYKPCGGLCWWGDAPCTEQRVTPQYARVFPCCLTRGAAVDRRRDARRETQEMIGHGFSVKNAPEGGKQQQRKAADAAKKSELADFQGATKFMGVKKGYVFKKGPKGIGYYVDSNPPKRGWINTGLASDNFI